MRANVNVPYSEAIGAAIDGDTPAPRAGGAIRPVLHEVVGQGRHGTVFRAVDAGARIDWRAGAGNVRSLAVKVAPAGEDLQDELAALKLCEHPNVIAVLDTAAPNELILEFCEGGTLADRVASRSITTPQLQLVLRDVAKALAHIHGLGWIHGDISSANIGIRSDSSPALLDFSLARPADGSPMPQGTPLYAGRLRTAVTKLDIRSLAAVAIEAIEASAESNTKAVGELESLIARAEDDTEEANLDEFAQIVESLSAQAPTAGAVDRVPSRSAGGPTTRDYGPRPSSGGSGDTQPASKSIPRILLAIAASIALIAVVADALLGTSSAEGLEPQVAISAPASWQGAEDTLSAADADWDISSGTLHVSRAGEEPLAWKVGEAGDLAAIGDWNCDGGETLGVYRPTTSTWFEFDSWTTGSDSSVTNIETDTPFASAVRLTVALDEHSCATPHVSTLG